MDFIAAISPSYNLSQLRSFPRIPAPASQKCTRASVPRPVNAMDSDQEDPARESPENEADGGPENTGITNPPDGFSSENPAPDIQQLCDDLSLFAKRHGFAIIRKNGRNKQGPQQDYTRYDILCDRYGDTRLARGTGLRVSLSRKCRC
ncbi:hypothetical protein B0T21DRAFT_426795 [Apiosordaria backusii]|uniref:Uncharacterized protein n=1 Tax=Apiosordaria backusii TaxID=314023 RepID=A0AA40DSE6_9PEZI|nr:hypothetical protein B0T21DRAFT_426795 [Apiosordaria backusii]